MGWREREREVLRRRGDCSVQGLDVMSGGRGSNGGGSDDIGGGEEEEDGGSVGFKLRSNYSSRDIRHFHGEPSRYPTHEPNISTGFLLYGPLSAKEGYEIHGDY